MFKGQKESKCHESLTEILKSFFFIKLFFKIFFCHNRVGTGGVWCSGDPEHMTIS